jgi:alcohol dehydrogenase class IV
VIEPFTWRDGDRIIRFGRGALAGAGELLGTGYALLATPRTLAMAPGVAAAAGSVHEVPGGYVEQLSAALLHQVPPGAELIVALGGGRVVDTAKAVAAGRGGGRVRAAAIPTTLSAAEMTRVHRLPAGAPPGTEPVRAAIVLNDPALSASQPVDELAASAANALGHAAEGAVTDRATIVPRLAAGEAVRLLRGAFGDGEPDRDALALGALLAGWTIDSTHYGLHHVLAQTMVRVGRIWHGRANAALLPHSLGALARRSGDRMLPGVESLAHELAMRAGAERLRDLGVSRQALDAAAEAAAGREDLDRTPPRADRAELLAIYEAAW